MTLTKPTFKLCILAALLTTFFFTSNAQDYKHKVDLGIPGLFLGNINLGYENVLTEKSSLVFHAGMLIPREVPSFLTFGDETADAVVEQLDNRFGGFSFVAEYRMYTGSKGAPYGFYFSPMLRYSRYSFNIGTDLDGESVDLTAALAKPGLGFQLGAQFKLGERMTFDWYFLGLGIDRNTVSLKIESSEPSADFAEIADDAQAEIDSWPLYSDKITITSDDNSVKGSAGILGLGIRSGFTLGFRF